MQVETKFLRLCQPAALGEEIDGWRVHWVGGWGRDRLFFYVMVAKTSSGVVNSGHARQSFGRRSRDTDVEEGWCDNIEEEHR